MMKPIQWLWLPILLLAAPDASAETPWRRLHAASDFPIMGTPIRVEQVITTREVCKETGPGAAQCYYTYKLILQRPSGDNGWGIVDGEALRFRLYYWAAIEGTNPVLALYHDKEVHQETHPDSRKVVVHLLQGLPPGAHRIGVAVIPYPMIGDYSLKDLIKHKPERLKQFYQVLVKLKSAPTWLRGAWEVAKLAAGDYAEEISLDELMEQIAYRYGEVGELEVLAKMPDIQGRSAADAERRLRARSLVPQRGPNVATSDRSREGTVARHRFRPGERLRAGTEVPYKLYSYRAQVNPQQGFTGPGGLFGRNPVQGFDSGSAVDSDPSGSFVPGSPPSGYVECGCFSTDGRNTACQDNGCVEPPNYLMTCYWECTRADGSKIKIRGRDGTVIGR